MNKNMSVHVAARTVYTFRKPLAYIFWVLALIILAAAVAFGREADSNSSGTYTIGNGISSEVLAWQGEIESELEQYGLEEHVSLVLAIIMQESGGTASFDIMQASESAGLPPNSITDPLYSIEVGIKHFADIIKQQEKAGVDLDTAIQSFNFGSGYLSYVSNHGGKHTTELAQAFSASQASKMGWASYGDIAYVDHVKRYLGTYQDGVYAGVSTNISGDFKAIMEELVKYEGYPYVFGGSSPSTSFDCSSLMQWGFHMIGINLPRTAQEQYDASEKITVDQLQAGDLVFFTGTYDSGSAVTHVGIYVGDGKMYDANGSGVGYTDLSNSYWSSHLYGYGRIADVS